MALKEIRNLFDLREKCNSLNNPTSYEQYRKLAIEAAKNIGAPQAIPTFEQALKWFDVSAMDTQDESGVVDEINYCLELVE